MLDFSAVGVLRKSMTANKISHLSCMLRFPTHVLAIPTNSRPDPVARLVTWGGASALLPALMGRVPTASVFRIPSYFRTAIHQRILGPVGTSAEK